MWERLYRSEYVRNTLTLVSGNSLAQLIPLLAEPVLTRLFPPQDFGLLALFISISSLFAIVATGRYELAVMLPRKDKDSVNLAALSGLVTLGMSLLSLLIVWAFNAPICRLLNSESISGYLYFVPLVVLFTGVAQTMNYWFSRKKQFGRVSAGRVVQSATAAGSGIGAGFMKAGAFGLITAQVLGHALSALYFIFRFVRSDKDKLREVSRKRMGMLAGKYADFPRVNALYIFTDTAQYSGISFLIAYFFNNTLLGFYSRTFRILTVPLSFIGSAISQVYYQKASAIHHEGGSLRGFSIRTLLGTAATGIPIFLLIILWGPDIFGFVLGQGWRPAGTYAQILSPWIFMKFITQPLTHLPMILNRQKQLFIFSLAGIALIFASLAYGGLVAGDLETAFYLISGSQSVYLLLLTAWLLHISGGKAA